jgi:DNA-nicking Smr family endonuclease
VNEPDEILRGEPVELPIDGVLDLHTFRPSDVKEVVVSYLEACRARGILEVRVVHGKGIGQLRQTVHALLARLPWVASYAIAGEAYGGTGATLVNLQPAVSDRAASGAGGA